MCKFIFPSINFKIEKWKWNEEYRIYVSSLGHFKDEHKKNMPIKINNKTGYCMITTPFGIYINVNIIILFVVLIPYGVVFILSPFLFSYLKCPNE